MTESAAFHVFGYLDYRVLLRDLLAQRQASSRAFSQRSFSRRARLRSTNFLGLVMKGARNLSPEMARRFAQALSLPKRERDYFCELVAFNQARSDEDRARGKERLARFRGHRDVRQLSAAQAAYYDAWYIPAVRELAARADFQHDPQWIAQSLQPRVSKAQAARALRVLLALGLLEPDPDRPGCLRQTAALVSTGPGPLGRHMVSYHRAMLERAAHALEAVPREEREISSLTLCVSHEVLLQLKERIREFRTELLQLAEREGVPERVVQLNFQLFPLSRKIGEKNA